MQQWDVMFVDVGSVDVNYDDCVGDDGDELILQEIEMVLFGVVVDLQQFVVVQVYFVEVDVNGCGGFGGCVVIKIGYIVIDGYFIVQCVNGCCFVDVYWVENINVMYLVLVLQLMVRCLQLVFDDVEEVVV